MKQAKIKAAKDLKISKRLEWKIHDWLHHRFANHYCNINDPSPCVLCGMYRSPLYNMARCEHKRCIIATDTVYIISAKRIRRFTLTAMTGFEQTFIRQNSKKGK